MSGFLGEYESKLDAKGRFLFPAGFRKQLPEADASSKKESPGQFVLNRGFEKCLSLYPLHLWQPIFERISALNGFDPKVRAFRRYFLNGAVYLDLDAAGRLLIPKNLSQYAGLEKEIILSSDVDKIEIWDKTHYQEFFESYSPETFSEAAKELMGEKNEM